MFSLIVATVDRTDELSRLLRSLTVQTYRNFEVIVVDQNPDDRLVPILKKHENEFSIMQFRSERGLSRARNIGLEHIRGDIVAFPDDDCWYAADLLESVARYFATRPSFHGITGRAVDETGANSSGRWARHAGEVNKRNVWGRAVSTSSFLKREVVEAVGAFDETLGAGSGTDWGSGEETDYLIRALQARYRLFYDPDIAVCHHEPAFDFSSSSTRTRAYRYGMGMGRVLRKHGYPLRFVVYSCLRPLVGALLFLVGGRPDKSRYHWWVFRGRLRGWLAK